jgi:hypothetical protein
VILNQKIHAGTRLWSIIFMFHVWF